MNDRPKAEFVATIVRCEYALQKHRLSIITSNLLHSRLWYPCDADYAAHLTLKLSPHMARGCAFEFCHLVDTSQLADIPHHYGDCATQCDIC